jgi:hypothetical protein
MKNFTTTIASFLTLKTSSCIALLFALMFPATAQTLDQIHVGFIYPISSHGTHAADYTNIFSLHALAGLSHEERGVTISGMTSVITNDASGVQIAGFSNHIGGLADGFKAAGFINTYGSGRGFQTAGFANIARGNVTGLQIAGFINTARDRKGIQLAGFSNFASDVKGHQVSGFINKAEDVKGIQAAGFMNVAKKVKGVQLAGFLNIADSSENPIGIINIIKEGEQYIGLSVDDNLTTQLAFRSGGKNLYGIIAVGNNFRNTKDIYSIQFGLGAHLITTRNFRLNAEASTLMLENFKTGSFTKYSLAILPAVKLGNRLELFGGPSLNLINTDTQEGRTLVDNYIWDHTDHQNNLSGMYLGYTAGLHMKL